MALEESREKAATPSLDSGPNAIKFDCRLSVSIERVGLGTARQLGLDMLIPTVSTRARCSVRRSRAWRFGLAFAVPSLQAPEVNMKLSREFKNEQQAEERERALGAAGYQAWRKQAPDGHWQVFWLAPIALSSV